MTYVCSVEHCVPQKKVHKHAKRCCLLARFCYNSAMENVNTTTAAARPSTADAEFEAQFGSESDIQDWQDWRASCLEADMSEPFLDDAH